jgi:lipopolysaccharide/colanic/teichoic acid biosynthesis glycosyltransferase
VLDILIGSAGVLVLALLLPFVALAIKLGSPGPVFYRQRRMGLNGATFNLVKFRTMAINAEADGNAVWASPNDPRVTGVGRVLRRLYIDEFPQWWNVLKGDMSVVGPRPERPELAARIVSFVPDFNRRLLAKPGLTGVAQVNYKYTNTMAEARNKLRLDMVYINAASFWLDAKLILRTVRSVSAI